LFVLLQFDGRVAVCMLTCRMLQSKSRFSCIFSARGGDLLYNQKFWIWNYSFPFWAILPVKIFNSLEFLNLLTLPIIGGNFRCSSPPKTSWFLSMMPGMVFTCAGLYAVLFSNSFIALESISFPASLLFLEDVQLSTQTNKYYRRKQIYLLFFFRRMKSAISLVILLIRCNSAAVICSYLLSSTCYLKN